MRTSFHHQPEAQHPNSSAIHKPPADYPIFRSEAEIERFSVCADPVAIDPKRSGNVDGFTLP